METSAEPTKSITPELFPEKNKIDFQDYRLISKATDDFENGYYEACLRTLEQLELTKGPDCKLLHNRAIAKFYNTKCKNYLDLLKTLEELDNQNNTEDDNAASTNEAAITSPPSYINMSLITYNKAVISFHRHMHENAIFILNPLISKLEKYDESSMALIGTLVLQLLLATNQLEKAYNFLENLLKHLGTNVLALTAEDSVAQDALLHLDENVAKNMKLLCILTMVVNRKPVLIPDDGSAEYVALKAHQYYIMKDFQMAAKQLKKINTKSYKGGLCDNELNTLIANNMGVIHLRVRHYAIAANFFQHAILYDKPLASNLHDTELHQMSLVRSCEILYNLGISMLHLRRPKEAFQCFLVPLKRYHNNPRLWFRISEACIMEYELKRMAEEKYGKGSINKRLVVSNRIPYEESSQSAAVPEPTLPFAALSLRNALTLTCFYRKNMNAAEESSTTEAQTDDEEIKNFKYNNNFCNPSGPVTKECLDTLLSCINAAYSYVSLRLGDYVSALEMAQELLKTEKISDAHKMLAHMYAGEALIMMDKVVEARLHLEPTFISTLNTFDFETKDWQVKSLDAAQSVVRYNLAVALILQGDFEKAKIILNTCTHPLVAAKIFNLKLYIEKTQITTPAANPRA